MFAIVIQSFAQLQSVYKEDQKVWSVINHKKSSSHLIERKPQFGLQSDTHSCAGSCSPLIHRTSIAFKSRKWNLNDFMNEPVTEVNVWMKI